MMGRNVNHRSLISEATGLPTELHYYYNLEEWNDTLFKPRTILQIFDRIIKLHLVCFTPLQFHMRYYILFEPDPGYHIVRNARFN